MTAEVYQAFFNRKGEIPRDAVMPAFLVALEPECRQYGQPEVIESVGTALNEALRNRRHDLGVQTVYSQAGDVAAAVWRNPKTGKTSVLAMTDGYTMVAADPCFLGDCVQGAGVGITSRRERFADFKSELLWVADTMHLLQSQGCVVDGLVSIEEVAKAHDMSLKEGVVQSRREYF